MTRDFDRAMAESADLLGDVLSEVEAPPFQDDFLVCQLGRLLEDGEPSFEDSDFRFLIQQGIRLEYDSDIGLRARFMERLRREAPEFRGRARRITPDVIGALEDVDFPLHRIGAVVRHYTRRLFARLEGTEGAEAVDDLGETIDQVFEFAGDPEIAGAAIGRLARLASPVAARALAYAVAEPVLDETLEEQASEALRAGWPAGRAYILYNLRLHAHEDIPFRWLELLVAANELRAVDRILEEVLKHARDPAFRTDLLASLDLLGRSADPGREGKVLRILTGPHAPADARRLLADWVQDSTAAAFLREALESGNPPPHDFVHLGEDFSSFAAASPGMSLDRVHARWNQAYHESLGWQQRSKLPRSALEVRSEESIQAAIIDRLPGPRPDEATLRELVESLRETWLGTPRDGMIPLVAIYRERPRENPWLEDVYTREINGLYIEAAGRYDDGDGEGARRRLDRLLEIEPEYPLATALDRVMQSQKSLHDLK